MTAVKVMKTMASEPKSDPAATEQSTISAAQSSPAKQAAKQVAALAWRMSPDGKAEILLVTSRISQHWLLPKGWPIKKKSNAQAAAQEALEEAGIEGTMAKSRIGKFNYLKLAADGSATPCAVSVFTMSDVRELADWPERLQRQRQWFTLEAATAAVFEPGLAALLSLLVIENDEMVLRRA